MSRGGVGNNHGRGESKQGALFPRSSLPPTSFLPRRVYESTSIREGQTSKVHRALPPFFLPLPWPPFTFSIQSARSLPVAGKRIQNRAAICPNILATIFNRMKPGALTEIFLSDECCVSVNFRFPFFPFSFLIPLIQNLHSHFKLLIGRHWIGEMLFKFVQKY